MAKPLTQKQLKAMQKKAQARLDAQKKELASLEQTYAQLKGTSKVDLSGDPGIFQARQKQGVTAPEGSMAANVAAQAKAAIETRDAALADPLISDPYFMRDAKTKLSPAQVDAKAVLAELAGNTGGKLITGTGTAGYIVPKPADYEDDNFFYRYLWVGSSSTTNTGSWKLTKVPKIKTTVNASGVVVDSNGDPIVTPDSPITTNLTVLKAMLRTLGFGNALIDSSADFLNKLLKDGLTYENAVDIFLESKEYTFKNGNKTQSPFYSAYGFFNEGLTRPKSAAELYSSVEGYKATKDKYQLNEKYISNDSIKKYLKNNVSVDELDERANAARLRSINADPVYTDALMKLGFIKTATDLTDFFLNPEIGKEALEQNRGTAAFSAEAIRRAQQGVEFSKARFQSLSAGLIGQGMTEAGITETAEKGFANIASDLKPLQGLSNVYGSQIQKARFGSVQEELEQEEFKGLLSQRRKETTELEKRSFQGSSGASGYALKKKTAGII
jgi:hypothetical protein